MNVPAVLPWIVCLCLMAAGATTACAHELRPAYLELRQTGRETYSVVWRVPGRGENQRLGLDVEFPAGTTNLTPPRVSMQADAFTGRWTIGRPGGLAGGAIRIVGLPSTMTDVLVRLEHLDGRREVARLTPASPVLVVSARPGWPAMARTYLWYGIEHIFTGIDHLLFVLGLLLIVGRQWRRLLKTITAFTIAHSITLALATLEVVRLPPAPVAAGIALSIVFVAAEIVHAREGCSGITARAPWWVAFAFGLLHGFGFAGALGEVGLPPDAVPLTLAMFNTGVEIGQLAFVALMLLAVGAARRYRTVWPRWIEMLPPYAIGGWAAFWTLERLARLAGE